MVHAVRLAGALACTILISSNAYAQKNRPASCGPDQYFQVTAAGAPGDTQGYGLYSDGAGPYVSGTERLEARFQIDNCTYDFTMNLNFTTRKLMTALPGNPTVNFVNFDRVATVPPTPVDDTRPLETFCATVPDNYAGCGFDAASRRYFVRRSVTMQLNVDGDNRLLFNKSPYESWTRSLCPSGGDQRLCQMSFIRVFRIEDDGDPRWVLEPEAYNALYQTPVPLAAQLLWTNKGVTYVTEHVVPFRMELRRQ